MAGFDLNVERVLEHWTSVFAMRELIANALDEAALTGTAEPEIARDGGSRSLLVARAKQGCPTPALPTPATARTRPISVQESPPGN